MDHSHSQGARKRQADHGDGTDEHADCDELAFAIAHYIAKARRWKGRAPPTRGERYFFTRSVGSAQASPSRTLAPQSSTPSLFRHGTGVRCALGNHIHGPHGEAAMTVVLNDLLLFTCLAAFVTGIVIAAATLLI